MSATVIPIRDEAAWLAERTKDITSTEVAALFGLSPYQTEFELWHHKRDGVVEALEPSERMRWGIRLQDAIAAGVAEDMGWEAHRLDVYMRDPEDRIGSSFDFEVRDDSRASSCGLMEIKNVDRMVFLDAWLDTPAGIEAPQHIELQAQHQMEVADRDWCAIVALVGGNEAKVTIRERDREIGQHIRRRVRAFWQSIEAGTPPKPDYDADADLLMRLHGRADKGVTIEADADVATWVAEHYHISTLAKQLPGLKARVFERIGNASKVTTPDGTLSCPEVAARPGRSGFRQFRFTPTKTKS